MGLFDRIRGRSGGDRSPLTVINITGSSRVPVVGESHYQGELASVAGPKRAGGVEIEVQAVLVGEPTNPYDANAVAIHINGAGKVGYLSRENALRFQPLVASYASRGEAAGCEAVILGGDARRQTQFCVWLHIAEPD